MRFLHHPDGYVMVGDTQIPLDVWERYEPDYELPEGSLGQAYEPGKQHLLMTADGQMPLGTTWAEGDIYIGKERYYANSLRRMANRQPFDMYRRIKPIWN